MRENDDTVTYHRTSVSLRQRHIDYLDSEAKNVSKYVRKLIDENIEQTDDDEI